MDDDGDISIAIDDPGWADSLGDMKGLAVKALIAIRGFLELEGAVTFVFADDDAVAQLNTAHRGKDGPTNVLSFPAGPFSAPPGEPQPLGDIILARETVEAEATAQGKPLAHHTLHLIVHGVLHLCGYDHVLSSDAHEMEDLERQILAELDIPDPYMAELSERP